ncbi:hypothetical protein PYCCODRAFT_1351255, partial [Trametes coccinea BRFM310]
TYTPHVYHNMQQKLRALYTHHPNLQHNFQTSLYPAASFNVGPAVVCLPHRDAQNDACNFYHITALAWYDPKTGGHIVLLEYKMIIEFPPSSSILIPSAIISHGNIAIKPHEFHQLVTQYCAGGLLRWVDAGF